jgi:CheY-like chemotaxis protein
VPAGQFRENASLELELLMSQSRYRVLVADDSEDYLRLIQHAFESSAAAEFLPPLSDGKEVVAYLEGRAEYADRAAHPYPHVLILDLKMPGMGGFQVLEYIRQRGLLLPKRVVVLTAFAQVEDIHRSYALGAHFISPKTADLRPLVQRIEAALASDQRSGG